MHKYTQQRQDIRDFLELSQDFSAHNILIEKLLPKTYAINSKPNPSHKDLIAVLDNLQLIIAAARAWESKTMSALVRIEESAYTPSQLERINGSAVSLSEPASNQHQVQPMP